MADVIIDIPHDTAEGLKRWLAGAGDISMIPPPPGGRVDVYNDPHNPSWLQVVVRWADGKVTTVNITLTEGRE